MKTTRKNVYYVLKIQKFYQKNWPKYMINENYKIFKMGEHIGTLDIYINFARYGGLARKLIKNYKKKYGVDNNLDFIVD